jgi:hypothetical protein
MCDNPQVDMDRPAVAELLASVAAAVGRRAATVSENVYEVTIREIPELHDDQTVLALFSSSIHSNVGTCLQIMQHQIDLAGVHAPAASLEEARRRAATLGYRLRQHHVGAVCWTGDEAVSADNITRLERAIGHIAAQTACGADPLFVPRDESSAWALAAAGDPGPVRREGGHRGRPRRRPACRVRRCGQGRRRVPSHPPAGHRRPGGRAGRGIRFAGGDLRRSRAGGDDPRIGGPAARVGAQHAGPLATDDEYRVRKAEESLGRPVADNRHDVELALQASRWLGSSVLRPPD